MNMTMTAISTINDKKTPIDKRLANMRQLMESKRDVLSSACSNLLSPDTMISVTISSFRKNPGLLDCTVPSLLHAVSEAANFGWTVDGVMGHAYIVPFGNRQRGTTEAVLIPGYKGLRDLIRRAGQQDVTMEAVHEGDEYEYKSRFELPHHVYSKNPKRKFQPVTHAYVVGHFKSGRVLCVSWTAEECMAHRDHYSQGWRRVKDNPKKAEESPWHPSNPAFRVMCMKSVLLDCIHRGEFDLAVEHRDLATRELHTVETVKTATAAPVAAADLDLGLDDQTVDSPAIEHHSEPEVDPERELELQSLFDGREGILKCQELEKELLGESKTDIDRELIKSICQARCDTIRASRGK